MHLTIVANSGHPYILIENIQGSQEPLKVDIPQSLIQKLQEVLVDIIIKSLEEYVQEPLDIPLD